VAIAVLGETLRIPPPGQDNHTDDDTEKTI